jgi:hypothetical protein
MRTAAHDEEALLTTTALVAGKSSSISCVDTDNGAADIGGDGCAAYNMTNPEWCSGFDDADFISSEMCCACGGGEIRVSGIVDPHLVNLRREHFDIYEPGNFVLLQVPRGAEPASTLLQVEAGVRVVGGPCSVYFQVITISGAWTNQTEPVLFTADPHSKPSTFLSAQWMYFGPVGVKVIHWRSKAPDFVDFLDIYAKNVGQTGLTVGGLLGSDGHKELAPRPQQCSLSRSIATSWSIAEARS